MNQGRTGRRETGHPTADIQRRNCGDRVFPVTIALMVVSCLHGAAAEVDTSKLPPAATKQVDFAGDIKPILESRCIRCHGTERPKSKFSLVTRESALRGGEVGVDIIPGQSARSPLIHYTARLVPEMEMPPEGKGEPLTPAEISLLRAWIDQGAKWEPGDNSAQYAAHFSFTPAVRWVTVSGNSAKFQEHQWIRRGVSGGATEFRAEQKLTNGASVVIEGRALTDDYRVAFDLRKEDLGFVRAGFQQFRKYYDDRGPYYPFGAAGFATFTPKIFQLDRDLYLDDGKAFAEFGLTLPDWPRIVVGYEFQYRDGTKSTEQWGPVRSTSDPSSRNIFPAWKDINEDVHILKLDVAYDVGGIHLDDNMRAEFWDLKTARGNDTSFPTGQAYPTAFTVTRDTHDQFLFANTLRGEKPVNDWLFLTAGYMYSQLDADATLRQSTEDGAGRPASGTFWSGNDIVLKQSMHVLNLNGLLGPWNGFTAALGVQTELSEQEGFGNINLAEGDPNDPTTGIIPDFGLVRSDIDKVGVDETALLRYTVIPMTVLFAEARLKQDELGKFEEEIGGGHDFLRDTDNSVRWQEYKGGFDISPQRQVALNASYTYRLHESDYDHLRDEEPRGSVGQGYPAFIRSRDSETHLFETRLVLRPATWIKTTLSYHLALTDYRTETDAAKVTPFVAIPGGRVFAGDQDSSIYSANVTLTPWRRFYLSTTFSYQDSKIETTDHGSAAVAPYRGDTFSTLVSATYALRNDTELTASYNYSRARYSQNNYLAGLPLGIDYDLHGVQGGIRHQFGTNVSGTLEYGFYNYEEPTAKGFNDYTAHMIFATVKIKLK